ncbi:MAG: peptidoglycan DD-metalloendopeptidase family protein [Deltaproteobacteria bacterium]|nr:peptidoglycan DD-metalloendopeptidase family protein [Deltaproteobacteria bacterium]
MRPGVGGRALVLAVLLGAGLAVAQDEDPAVTLAATRLEEQGVLGEIDRVDRQLRALGDEIEGLRAQSDAVESRRLRMEGELAASQAAFDREASEVQARCRALYRLVRTHLARALFDAESPADLRRRARYLLAVLQHDRARLANYTAQVERRRATLASVDRDRATVATFQADLRVKEAALRDERARKVALLDDVRKRRDLARVVLEERARVESELAATLAETSQAAPKDPATPAAAPSAFRTAYGRLPWPVAGRVVRGYGVGTDPVTGETTRNTGVDIEAPYGTPFRAVYGGTVHQAGFIRGFGQTVVLEHGAHSTVYAHANGLKVVAGQQVGAGDVLGFVGNSGLVDTSGYLLHFEVRYHGTPQDPLAWLQAR